MTHPFLQNLQYLTEPSFRVRKLSGAGLNTQPRQMHETILLPFFSAPQPRRECRQNFQAGAND